MLKAVIDTQATTGGEFLATGTREAFEYVNGVKGAQIGFSIDCVLPRKAFAPLTVRVQCGTTPPIPEIASGDVVPVRFDGLELKQYVRDNRIMISASAAKVSVVVAQPKQ